jgi:hypothetical protein
MREPPKFKGVAILSDNYLPPISVPVKEKFLYSLPETFDPNGDTVKIFVTPGSALLISCKCFRLTSSSPQQIEMTLPYSMWGNVVTFNITLRDTYLATNYFLNITAAEPLPIDPPKPPVDNGFQLEKQIFLW